MSTSEDEAARQLRDQALDAALELTFPASDPIALSVPTPEPAGVGRPTSRRKRRGTTVPPLRLPKPDRKA